MSKNKESNIRKWTIVGYATLVSSPASILLMALLNTPSSQVVMREWSPWLIAVVALSGLLSLITLFTLPGRKKVIGVIGIILSFAVGYLMLYTYALSYYGY